MAPAQRNITTDLPDLDKVHFPDKGELESEVNDIVRGAYEDEWKKRMLKTALACLDLTTLEGTDTPEKVRSLCDKAAGVGEVVPAAVCVYPLLVGIADEALKGSDIKVASVAGGFPAGQLPLHLKLEEVKYALEAGANEIDVVFSRGMFLSGQYKEIFDEIAAIRELCDGARLKVILETGELETPENIRKASDIALYAGADFIKTSTGKVQPGATLSAGYVMLKALQEHHETTGAMAGVKFSGGISDVDTAFQYLRLVEEVLGVKYLHPEYLRFGASRLMDDVTKQLDIHEDRGISADQ